VALIGHGKKADGESFRLRGTVAGTQDPGYGETAKMLGESALCLEFNVWGGFEDVQRARAEAARCAIVDRLPQMRAGRSPAQTRGW
jgi:hypothetical protein